MSLAKTLAGPALLSSSQIKVRLSNGPPSPSQCIVYLVCQTTSILSITRYDRLDLYIDATLNHVHTILPSRDELMLMPVINDL